MAAALALVACGDPGPSTETIGSDEAASAGAPLEAVLESWSAVIDDLPAEWTQHAQWIVEGAETVWDTGCAAFDDLAELYQLDVPTVTVWRAEGIEATHRVASREQFAAAYLDTVRSLVDECPTITVDGVSIEISPLPEGVIASTPGSDWAGVALSAYPTPDEATAKTTPVFDDARTGYLIVLARHNVVSQLVIGTDGAGGRELIDGIVIAADAALQTAPTDPVSTPPAPPVGETPPAQRIELRLDRETCRNGGGFEVNGLQYALTGPVPVEWRTIDPLVGDAIFEDDAAEFTGPDEQRVVLTTGPVTNECVGWEIEPPAPPVETIGRLDCTGLGIDEVRVPDEGQGPEAIAVTARPDVIGVEAGQPLQWFGVDEAGVVVVAVFLGDADGADYQVFTCGEG